LHEGLAKVFETRWRSAKRLPPEPDRAALLRDAIASDSLITFEAMSPSFAMLPSREQAALAYTQVETMLGFLEDERGGEALRAVIDEVAAGADAQDAIAAAWGAGFDAFTRAWKDAMRRGPARGPAGPGREVHFRDPEAVDTDQGAALGDLFSHLGGGRARQHARLGVLLTLRGHLEAAAIEYRKARAADPKAATDPALCRRLGELLLALGDAAQAVPLLERAAKHDPENATLAAAHGRALLRAGEHERARAALERAIRNNPFVPTIHCDLAELESDPDRRAFERAQCRD
jgi:tetratricopeptide (TPR) repeat protein